MFYTGLCSVTFRELSPEAIVEAAVKAGIDAIEWGSDVHVPTDDLLRAAEVKRMSDGAGLRVSSYGSYYRVGCRHDVRTGFEAVLESAQALGAPVIRVWAGDKGSAETDEDRFMVIVEDARRIASMAEAAGIAVAFEYHNDTMTDTLESTLRLLRVIDHPNMRCYWQAGHAGDYGREQFAIRQLAPYLSHIHVSHCSSGQRSPLSEGVQEWGRCIRVLAELERDFHLLLEFVRGDEVDQMIDDAAALKALVGRYSGAL